MAAFINSASRHGVEDEAQHEFGTEDESFVPFEGNLWNDLSLTNLLGGLCEDPDISAALHLQPSEKIEGKSGEAPTDTSGRDEQLCRVKTREDQNRLYSGRPTIGGERPHTIPQAVQIQSMTEDPKPSPLVAHLRTSMAEGLSRWTRAPRPLLSNVPLV